MMFVYTTLFISWYLSMICYSATSVVKPGNPLNVLKKYLPKRPGTLQHPSSSSSSVVTATVTLVSTVERPTRRPTRREVYSHSILNDSPPMPSTLLNGDKSYKDNKKVTRNLNAADAFHKFQYMMTNWKTNSLKTSCDDNTTALAPRATVTKANGRDKTGHPLSKDYDENTREPVWRATVTEVNGRALTGNPVSDYGGSPEEAEKYYDEVDQPAVVWKTGIYGSFKVGRRNSADDDDDDDDDEHQNMMLEDVTCENM